MFITSNERDFHPLEIDKVSSCGVEKFVFFNKVSSYDDIIAEIAVLTNEECMTDCSILPI